MRGHHGRGRGADHRQRRGQPDDAQRRGLHRGGGATRRPDRQAPSDHQPDQHRLCSQAAHRAQARRPPHRRASQAAALRPVCVGQRRCVGGDLGPQVLTLRDWGGGPEQDEGVRRGVPRRDRVARHHHRPGLLQRQPAPGDQGRRQDRRAHRRADHQRAHRRHAGLRPAREGHRRRGQDHGRLRPRRRHVRHLAARAARRRVRGPRDRGRHDARRR